MCEHDWDYKHEHSVFRGSNIYLVECKKCGIGKVTLWDSGQYYLTPKGKVKFLTTYKNMEADDFATI